MSLNIDKVYITHWSKLTNRKEWLIKHLTENNIDNYTWAENYDKDNWNIEDIKKDYPLVFDLNPKGRNLKYSEISLVLKHCWIIKDAFTNGYDSVLILEDDVLLEDDFLLNFVKFIFWSAIYICSLNSINASGAPNNLNINSMERLVPFDLNK